MLHKIDRQVFQGTKPRTMKPENVRLGRNRRAHFVVSGVNLVNARMCDDPLPTSTTFGVSSFERIIAFRISC